LFDEGRQRITAHPSGLMPIVAKKPEQGDSAPALHLVLRCNQILAMHLCVTHAEGDGTK